MKAMFLSLLVIVMQSHSAEKTSHKQTIDRILIINSFDAQSIEARKNKKALFGELTDSLKTMLKFEFERKQNREVIIVPGLINNPQEKDSVYIELINKYSATQAIVIKNLNAYFEQTGVAVVKEPDGKK